MVDILRSFRLGIINLLGVTVPGLIVLLLVTIGFIVPIILLFQDIWFDPEANYIDPLHLIPVVGTLSISVQIVIVLILAYIIGYIFRLSTPDDLDTISIKRVIKKMGGVEAAKKDHWPHHGEQDNKFPYFHFRDYLEHRKHNELLEYVDWNKNQRSKTTVNKLKLETYIRSQKLSAIIESNEAHIRLLFGTWHAMRLCILLVGLGWLISLYGLINSTHISRIPFLVLLVIGIILIIGSGYIIRRIQNLFHYRRVRELFDIIACTHLARTGFDSAGQPLNNAEIVN